MSEESLPHRPEKNRRRNQAVRDHLPPRSLPRLGQSVAYPQFVGQLVASPKAQFVGQLVGTGAGCVMVVAAWILYSTAYDIPGAEFPSPTTFVWLSMAEVVNGGGIDLTAMHVVPTAIVAAGITILLPILEATIIPTHRSWMVPSAMAAAIGMYGE